MSNLTISEIFGPTVQGEGALIGKPTVFVRTGGCDYRCSWCDTLYAVLPEHKSEWKSMTTEEVFAQIQQCSAYKPILVTLSGGNPAIQPLGDLIDLGHSHGYTFTLETQGSVAQEWFGKLDYLVLSPKPPSSNMETRWERLERCLSYINETQTSIKVVVFDEADYDYARYVAVHYPGISMYLQVGNHTHPQASQEVDTTGLFSRLTWLIDHVVQDRWYEVTVLPQMHVLLWGNQRGV